MLPFYSAIKTILRLKRKCPKCGKEQLVIPSKKNSTVPCKFCKASIPPPKEV